MNLYIYFLEIRYLTQKQIKSGDQYHSPPFSQNCIQTSIDSIH